MSANCSILALSFIQSPVMGTEEKSSRESEKYPIRTDTYSMNIRTDVAQLRHPVLKKQLDEHSAKLPLLRGRNGRSL